MTNAPLKGDPYHDMFTPLSASFPHWTKVTLERLLPYKRTNQSCPKHKSSKVEAKMLCNLRKTSLCRSKGVWWWRPHGRISLKPLKNYKRKKKKKKPTIWFQRCHHKEFLVANKDCNFEKKKRFSLQVERLVSKACCRFEWKWHMKDSCRSALSTPTNHLQVSKGRAERSTCSNHTLHFRSDRTDRNTWKERKGHI